MAVVQGALSLGDEVGRIPRRWAAAGAGRIDDDVVWRVISLIDGSPLVDRIEDWKKEDKKGPGGRPERFPVRALLVAMLLCATIGQPMLASTFTDVLFRQISPTMRHALGVPKPPERLDLRGWDAAYRNVRTRFHRLMDLMDPSPTPKNRRLSDVDFVILMELRRGARTDEEWDRRRERLTWFINQILEISIATLPPAVRRRWKGSAAVDATVVKAFARHDRRKDPIRKRARPEVITHSADPDADWYHRGERTGRDGEVEPKLSIWGMRPPWWSVAATIRPTPRPYRPWWWAWPLCTSRAPSPDATPQSRSGVSMREATRPIIWPGTVPTPTPSPRTSSCLPGPSGTNWSSTTRSTNLGVQDSYEGMLLVDGGWYSPGMPEKLINATRDLRYGKIDEQTHRVLMVERWKYAILPKAGPDPGGHVRLRCPASNPSPVARCENKPSSEGPSTRGKLRIPVTDALLAHPPKICTAQSITVPPEAGAKFAQPLLHESDEWNAIFATLRSSVEGMNGYIKDGSREALDDPERRRIRGVAPQSVFTAFLLCGANLRKIESYRAEAESDAAGSVRRLPKRRATKDLRDWLPVSAEVATIKGPSPGPDPPLIA